MYDMHHEEAGLDHGNAVLVPSSPVVRCLHFTSFNLSPLIRSRDLATVFHTMVTLYTLLGDVFEKCLGNTL